MLELPTLYSAKLQEALGLEITVFAKAFVALKIRETPKSPIFRIPPADMKIFCGFKSLHE